MKLLIAVVALQFFLQSIGSISPNQDSQPIKNMEAITVTGVQSGPALIKAEGHGKKLFLLPTIRSFPKDIEWSNKEISAVIANSDAILDAPGINIGTNIGIIAGIGLWRDYKRTRYNPDGKLLNDILDKDQYVRWVALRNRYLKSSNSTDKLRPVYAAAELSEAVEKSRGLARNDLLIKSVKKIAKSDGKPIYSSSLHLILGDPKKVMNAFNSEMLNDVPCLVATMDNAEKDAEISRRLAIAWSIGDMDVLRKIELVDQSKVCAQAMASATAARSIGINDVDSAVLAAWGENLDKAFIAGPVVVAIVPWERIRDGSIVGILREKGFEVEGY